ncbi:uncharacterized protein EV420DRAFT_1545921, partial [Desarmillaria tabescens]
IPNIAQVFGICRSPNFPAIIPFDDYERNLTAKQIVPFYIQLSVAEHLFRHYPLSAMRSRADAADVRKAISLSMNTGQIVVTAMVSFEYLIGSFIMWISRTPGDRVQFWGLLNGEPHPSEISRWSSSLTLRKDNLCNVFSIHQLNLTCRVVY